MTGERPLYICRVCDRVLTTRTNQDGVTLEHGPHDRDDHEVEPIPAPPGWAGGDCDLCGAKPPTHVLPVKDFRVPGRPNETSQGNWAACEKCANLIKFRRWADLEQRVFAAQRGKGVPDLLIDRVGIHRLYARLRKNITGPIRPIAPKEEK